MIGLARDETTCLPVCASGPARRRDKPSLRNLNAACSPATGPAARIRHSPLYGDEKGYGQGKGKLKIASVARPG